MCAGHGNDLCLLHQQVVDAVSGTAQKLKWSELLQLLEYLAQMSKAALSMYMCMYTNGLHIIM